jgi:hypothetical protein
MNDPEVGFDDLGTISGAEDVRGEARPDRRPCMHADETGVATLAEARICGGDENDWTCHRMV